MNLRPPYLTLLALAAAGLLAGCAPAPAAAPSVPPSAAPATNVPETAAPATAATPTASDPGAGGSTPTARAGLEATDPTSVILASGKPALVEFFAFW